MKLRAAFAFAALVLASCPGPTFVVQQYNGPPRAREEIAILRVNGNDTVRLVYLDNEDVAVPIESDSRLHIEVLPGRHSVGARGQAHQALVETLVFDAQADHVYRIANGQTLRVFEVDRGSDAMIRDVTIDPEPLPRAPPPAPPPPPVVEDAGTPL